MAYARQGFSDFGRDEEERDTTQTRGPGPISGAGGAYARGPAAGAAAAAPSGRFVNFSQVLRANQGAANRTAGRVMDNVETQAQGAQQARQEAAAGFRDAAIRGTNRYETGRADAAQRATQGYAGPSSLAATDGYEGLAKRTQEAAGTVDATKDSAGLQALMGQQGMAASTTGGRRFDAGLVGYSGQPGFSAVRNRYGGLQAALDTANKDSEAFAGKLRTASESAAGMYGEDAKKQADAAAEKKRLDDEATAQRKAAAEVSKRGATVAQRVAADGWFHDMPGNSAADHQRYFMEALKDENHPDHKKALADVKRFDETYGPGAWEAYVAYTSNQNTALTATNGGVAGGRV